MVTILRTAKKKNDKINNHKSIIDHKKIWSNINSLLYNCEIHKTEDIKIGNDIGLLLNKIPLNISMTILIISCTNHWKRRRNFGF